MTSLKMVFLLASLATWHSGVAFAADVATKPSQELLKPGDGQRPPRSDGRNRDPRQAIFHTNVPEHPLDVILARPEKNEITVSVLAYSEIDVQVVYGTRLPLDKKTEVIHLKKDEPHHIPLEKLAANTHYFYVLMAGPKGSQLVKAAEGEFRTARPKGESFKFAVQADSHLDGATVPELYARTMENIAADKPDFLIDLGDTFMNDKYPQYRQALPQYIAQRYYFGLGCASAPLFLVLGNHDGEVNWRRGRDSEGMAEWSNATRKKYFANPVADQFYSSGLKSSASLSRQSAYAWEWGDALFVALDPFFATTDKPRSDDDGWNWTLGREQYDWLAATLTRSKSRYKFIFSHHLVGGSGRDARGGIEFARFYEWGGESPGGKREFSAKRPGWPAPIHELLVKNHVTAFFHGHDHLYARQILDGVSYVETPQPSHPASNNIEKMAGEYGYKNGTILGSPGYLRLSVSPLAATMEYVRSATPGDAAEPANGAVADSFKFPSAN